MAAQAMAAQAITMFCRMETLSNLFYTIMHVNQAGGSFKPER